MSEIACKYEKKERVGEYGVVDGKKPEETARVTQPEPTHARGGIIEA